MLKINKGDKYGRLTIIKEVEGVSKRNLRKFKCKCDCGNIKDIILDSMRQGSTKSCGCLAKENKGLKKGTSVNKKHGMSRSKIYKKYECLKSRCYDTNNISYKNYGGRGIKNEWNNFGEFHKDMGDGYKEGLSIDRIDNNGNYSKENCRWSTRIEQNRNKRNNINIKYKGNTKTLIAWCEELSLNYEKTRRRLKYQLWSVEKTFTN